jgi:hypothetical protein
VLSLNKSKRWDGTITLVPLISGNVTPRDFTVLVRHQKRELF